MECHRFVRAGRSGYAGWFITRRILNRSALPATGDTALAIEKTATLDLACKVAFPDLAECPAFTIHLAVYSPFR